MLFFQDFQAQARIIKQLIFATSIQVPDENIIAHMSGRCAHLASGRTYHIIQNPPKVENVDDITGAELVQRANDNEATIRSCLGVYHEQIQPLVDYYYAWMRNDDNAPKYGAAVGIGSLDEVRNCVYSNLG